MDDEILRRKQELIRRDLAIAQDDLETAQINLANEKYRGAANRAYYAVFHTTEAVLLWHNLERSKHSGVASAFAGHLIRLGLIEQEYFDIFQDLRDTRETQDYKREAEEITEADAKQLVANAVKFIDRMKQYLRDVGAIE